MGRDTCCSICGVYYGRHGNLHRCSEKAIENLDRGRKTWDGDAVTGRQQGVSFGVRLMHGFRAVRETE